MKFFKGLFGFVLMLALSLCIMVWLSFNILGKTVLFSDTNTRLLAETEFSNELVSGVLEKYNTSMGQLSFKEDDLMKFVNDSGDGVINYVFLETETMPSVDVSFIKTYIEEIIDRETKSALDGKLDVSEFVNMLRAVPDGESIYGSTQDYFKSIGIDVPKEELDSVTSVFMDNREESDDVIVDKIVESVTKEIIDISGMNTELSLQDLFDNLMKKNPFTILRNVMEIYNKNVNGYLVITIILLALIIVVTEFRIGTASVWFALAMILAILPLQALRLADFFIDRDFLNMFDGMSSYSEFMINEAIDKLNVYSIIFLVSIIVLFIIGKVVSKINDAKILEEGKKSPSRFRLIRFAGFVALLLGLYLNGNAAYEMNLNFYNEVSEIEISDFDIGSIDLTLRNLLNVDYDF